MVKVIPDKSAWNKALGGAKDGLIGGLSVGLTRLFLGATFGSIVGGVIGGAIANNEVVALNGTMDGIAALFL